jgi:hypothetical membrane protein
MTKTDTRGTGLSVVLWILGGVGWLTGEAITAAAYPRYSYATNYISDLGVPEVGSFQGRAIDSPLHAVMNTTFIGHGILFGLAGVLVAVLVRSASRRVRAAVGVLAALHFVGILLVGLFHGSEASVESGAIVLHVSGAAVAILSGNVLAIVAGTGSSALRAPRAYRVVSVVLGVVGIVSLVMLLVDSSSSVVDVFPDGVWERASVYTIVAWELMTGVTLAVSSLRGRG